VIRPPGVALAVLVGIVLGVVVGSCLMFVVFIVKHRYIDSSLTSSVTVTISRSLPGLGLITMWPRPSPARPRGLVVFEVLLKCFLTLTLKIMTFSIQCVDTEAVACVQRRSWSF